MATVISLSDHPRRIRRDEPPAGGATIHLFLGVRYERHPDPDMPKLSGPNAPARGGGKGRKRA